MCYDQNLREKFKRRYYLPDKSDRQYGLNRRFKNHLHSIAGFLNKNVDKKIYSCFFKKDIIMVAVDIPDLMSTTNNSEIEGLYYEIKTLVNT